jgi:hypothetical protein
MIAARLPYQTVSLRTRRWWSVTDGHRGLWSALVDVGYWHLADNRGTPTIWSLLDKSRQTLGRVARPHDRLLLVSLIPVRRASVPIAPQTVQTMRGPQAEDRCQFVNCQALLPALHFFGLPNVIVGHGYKRAFNIRVVASARFGVFLASAPK